MVPGNSKVSGSSECLAVDGRRFYDPAMDAGRPDRVVNFVEYSFVDYSFVVSVSAGTCRPSSSKID